jgi:hypothetical protein
MRWPRVVVTGEDSRGWSGRPGLFKFRARPHLSSTTTSRATLSHSTTTTLLHFKFTSKDFSKPTVSKYSFIFQVFHASGTRAAHEESTRSPAVAFDTSTYLHFSPTLAFLAPQTLVSSLDIPPTHFSSLSTVSPHVAVPALCLSHCASPALPSRRLSARALDNNIHASRTRRLT